MKIDQTTSFKKSVKKLHSNQKKDLDQAVRTLMKNPLVGEEKKGDLVGVRVHKFKMVKFLTLLAYTWEEELDTLTLLKLSSHENFYRDLKKRS